jgi:formylglycine-generating enzyme required for sulfatase activity
MKFLTLVLLIPAALLALCTAAEPRGVPAGIQTQVRTSIGEDRGKGEQLPEMVSVGKSKAVIGLSKDEMRALLETYTAEGDRQVIVGSYPEHAVEVENFLMDEHEVTNLQFRTWLQATGRKPSEKLVKENWPKGDFPAGQENFPVCGVNLVEAQACARWMGKRLPTEEEWELAARGNDAKAKDNRFVWGKTWDHTKCANARSTRGNTVAVMSFKETDVSPFGIYDMMGNVAEWTTSVYTSYPAFKPVEAIDPVSKKQVTIRPGFQTLWYTVRGGSAEGNEATCNTFIRQGFSASDRWTRIGFRCAKSWIPGRDALDDAVDDLTLVSEVNKNPLNLKDLCAQEVFYFDPSNHLITGSKKLALGHVEMYRVPMSKLMVEAVDEPVLVGVITTSEKMEYPKLPQGSYGILFKPAGTPKAKKAEVAKDDKDKDKEKEAKAKEKEKDGKDKPKAGKDTAKADPAKPKDAPKAGEAPKAGTAPTAKPGDASKPPETTGKPTAEAPSKPADATGNGANGNGGEADLELERIGARSTLQDVEYPLDKDLFLFKATNGKVVAFVEAEKPTEGKRVKANFTYGRAAANEIPKAMMLTSSSSTATTVKADEDLDVASFDFYVLSQHPQANAPRFKLRVFFKANTFEPEDGQ